MLMFETWKRVLILGVLLIGILFALPNAFYDRVEQSNDAAAAVAAGNQDQAANVIWPAWLPSGLVNLGLDLRGGAHLLAEVQVTDVYADRVDAFWPPVRDALAAERDTLGFISRDDGPEGELRVRIANPDQQPRAIEIIQGLFTPVSSLASIGATDFQVVRDGDLLVISLSDAEKAATDDRTMQLALEIVRRRIDEAGTREPTIQRQGADRILIQVPGVGSAQEVKDLIGATAQLTFRPVVRQTTDGTASPGPNNEILPALNDDEVFYILERTPVVSGEDLVDAQPGFDRNGRPAVTFRFDPTGARAFGDYTAENIGSPFAIVLDNEVISAPVIQSHIPGGSGIITGDFTLEETTNLAILLRAGALPAELTFLEERTIGPELGQDSIDAGKVAALVGLIAIAVFMVLTYGLFGVFANIALGMNIILIFGALSMIGATLTLPGIAGIVLIMGMAVDANVLIFERIREELRTTKTPAKAISLGFERALSAIIDSNITTFMTAVILYMLGSGPVRGFAITLGLGIITSVFTAVYVTRLIIVIWYGRTRPKTIEV